jgi:biotin carboxyl carrier protein
MYWRDSSTGLTHEITIQDSNGRLRAVIDGRSIEFEWIASPPGEFTLNLDDRTVTIYYASDGPRRQIWQSGHVWLLEPSAPGDRRRSADPGAESLLLAPMPAQVRSVNALAGDFVEKGQTLLILEAMKMELRISAPRTGKLIRVLVSPGQTVGRDQPLVEIEL